MPEGISHAAGVFHSDSYFTNLRSGFISLKKVLFRRTRPFSGADDEARTRYLHLGKVALYQMSYIRKLRV